MSFFNKIFGVSNTKSEHKNFWNDIKTKADLEYAILKSNEKKVIIFKHSTRCFISKTVLKNFEKEVEISDKKVEYFLLDLLSYRDLSEEITNRFGIEHQSPQMIVLENGKVIQNASHQSITLSLV